MYWIDNSTKRSRSIRAILHRLGVDVGWIRLGGLPDFVELARALVESGWILERVKRLLAGFGGAPNPFVLEHPSGLVVIDAAFSLSPLPPSSLPHCVGSRGGGSTP